MPHKYNAARHHIPRPKRRVTNWAAYNEALRQRGSLTVWFTDDAIAAWKAAPRTTACCTEEEEAKEVPLPGVDQATRTEFGRSAFG